MTHRPADQPIGQVYATFAGGWVSRPYSLLGRVLVQSIRMAKKAKNKKSSRFLQ